MATATLNLAELNADDRRAARAAITQENQRITFENQRIAQANVQRAENVPPLDPLPLLPLLLTGTAAEIKNAYEPLLAAQALAQHNAAVKMAIEQATANLTDIAKIKALAADATTQKRAAALAAYEAAIV